jgi:hypothetical protein
LLKRLLLLLDVRLEEPIGAPAQLAAKYHGERRTHKQVNVVVLALHLNKFCLEIAADFGKDGAKSVASISVQHPKN